MIDKDLEDTQKKACGCYGPAHSSNCSVGTFDSSDANLGSTKKGYAVPKDSVYTKEIWNAAIEACINLVAHEDKLNLRKLKK